MNKDKPGINNQTFQIVFEKDWLNSFNLNYEIESISEPIFKGDYVEYSITVKNNKKQIKKLIELKQLASLKK